MREPGVAGDEGEEETALVLEGATGDTAGEVVAIPAGNMAMECARPQRSNRSVEGARYSNETQGGYAEHYLSMRAGAVPFRAQQAETDGEAVRRSAGPYDLAGPADCPRRWLGARGWIRGRQTAPARSRGP